MTDYFLQWQAAEPDERSGKTKNGIHTKRERLVCLAAIFQIAYILMDILN